MSRSILFIFLFVLAGHLFAQTGYSFTLSKDNKTVRVDTSALIEIYLPFKNEEGESVKRKVSGIFKGITKEEITLLLFSIKDNNAKKIDLSYPDIKIESFSISDITEIVTVNRKLEKTMQGIFFASLFAAVVVSPLASINNHKLNWSRVGMISGISGGVAVLTLVISGTCWVKHHTLRATKPGKEVWKIIQ